VGTLRTSEDGGIAAGEGRKSERVDEDRKIDDGAKIIISAGPVADASKQVETALHAGPQLPRRSVAAPAVPIKQGGLGLVILLYLLAATALGYAIYERYLI